MEKCTGNYVPPYFSLVHLGKYWILDESLFYLYIPKNSCECTGKQFFKMVDFFKIKHMTIAGEIINQKGYVNLMAKKFNKDTNTIRLIWINIYMGPTVHDWKYKTPQGNFECFF